MSAITLPWGADYGFSDLDLDRLWRAQRAVSLLAALDSETADRAAIAADGPAAVAAYIREDLETVLNSAIPLDRIPEHHPGADMS